MINDADDSKDKRRFAIETIHQVSDKTELKLGFENEHDATGRSLTLAGRATSDINAKTQISLLAGQEIVSADGDDDSYVGAGLNYAFNEALMMSSEVIAHAEGHIGGKFGLTNKDEKGLEQYATWTLQDWSTQDQSSQVVMGGRHALSDTWQAFAEERLSFDGSQIGGATHALGLDYDSSRGGRSGTTFQFSGEFGEVAQKMRIALSTSAGWKDQDSSIKAALEYRYDEDLDQLVDDEEMVLATVSANYQTAPDWQIFTEGEVMVISDLPADMDPFEAVGEGDHQGLYAKGKLGAAYRPVGHDALNALFSYSYLYDMPSEEQLNRGQFRQSMHLLAGQASYLVHPDIRISGSYALKTGEQSLDRTTDSWSDMRVELTTAKAEAVLSNRWDAMVEGRLLSFDDPDYARYAGLAALYYKPASEGNVRLGVGYNWGGVDNQLYDEYADASGLFLNLVGAF